MNATEQEWFKSLFSLVEKHQKLLGDFLPLANEISEVLRNGTPSPEQLDAWREHYDEMNRRLYELNEALAELHQVVDPSLRYDA